MLKTFQSSSAAERLGAASAFVERFPTAAEVLIVGASRDAADDLARRVTAARGAALGLHRAGLTELAVRFAADEVAAPGVAPATALGAIATRAAVGGALDLLRRMPMVLLDVSIASPAERAFVEALTAMSPATLVTIPAGDDATLDAVRGLGARDRRDEQADGDGVG